MFSQHALLLFWPQRDVHQWLWGLKFLGQCHDAAFERNAQQLGALGAYSHDALKNVLQVTGTDHYRLECGIAPCYTDTKLFDTAGDADALMRKYSVERRVVSIAELLAIEPAFRQFAHCIAGGTYTASNKSGDAWVLTQALCRARRRVTVRPHHQRFEQDNNAIKSIAIKAGKTKTSDINGSKNELILAADACVVACGSYSAPLLRTVGVDLPIYPGKSYSATFKLLKPEAAPSVSLIDDQVKCIISRLDNQLRVADTRLESDGAHPTSGPACGLPRPSTFLILAKRLWEVFGSTRAMARWAGPTAQARARH